MRLQLVEDGPMIGTGICHGLSRDGHAVDSVRDGVASELASEDDAYEVVLLDLGLLDSGIAATISGGLHSLVGFPSTGAASPGKNNEEQTESWTVLDPFRPSSAGAC
jgi:hypothetical protein